MPIPHLLNPGALAESSLCWNLQQETLQTEKYDAYTSPHTFTLDALRGTNSFKAALFKIDSSSSPFETGTEANRGRSVDSVTDRWPLYSSMNSDPWCQGLGYHSVGDCR